jgi:single-stranded-DNA-specific exonuclease
MQDEALVDLESSTLDLEATDAYTLCLFRPSWHQGVVGIVASRLKDRFHRPAIVFARGAPGELKGSGRSIAGFHLRDALDLCAKRAPGLIARFGGHAFAAGLSIAEAALPHFADVFEQVARDLLLPADLARIVESDGSLRPGELTFGLAQRLREPVWGQGFPAPAFDDEFDVDSARVVGDAHTKLVLQRSGERFEAMLFRSTPPMPPRIRAVFRPELEHYQGLAAIRLLLLHWEPV